MSFMVVKLGFIFAAEGKMIEANTYKNIVLGEDVGISNFL